MISSPWVKQNTVQDLNLSTADTKIYGRDELLARLQTEAESIVSRRDLDHKSMGPSHSPNGSASSQAPKHVIVGFVGYPNVGKSSTINALVGEKRTGVTSTPGKTKHFQTLIISDELVLCDCPGLVFPSFSSSRYEMIASGVLPIDRMTEHREAVQVVANRAPRHILEGVYNITLPKPKPYELQSRPPLASELLRAYCSSRGYVSSSGLPDETRAARQILKDYIDGKLPHFEMPPGIVSENRHGEVDEGGHGLESACGSDSSDVEGEASHEAVDGAGGSDLSNVLNDLDSFDAANGLSSTATAAASAAKKKASASASYKHHKKPQRKKDRSWRVKNDGDDGMPVVRTFQKQVNLGPVAAS